MITSFYFRPITLLKCYNYGSPRKVVELGINIFESKQEVWDIVYSPEHRP
ncbi:hypothetical protein M2135_002430, partial [Parabacteroides sp. PF5-9]|nr:hypothetical protein [Parabacteroides sp. PF5-9]